MCVRCEDHTVHVNTLYEQNSVLVNAKLGGMFSGH